MGRRRRRRRRSVNKPEASAPAPVARPIARPTQRPSANLTSTQDALQRLRANRPDFMKPRPMTNQGNMATNMSQAIQAQSMRMAPKGYKHLHLHHLRHHQFNNRYHNNKCINNHLLLHQ